MKGKAEKKNPQEQPLELKENWRRKERGYSCDRSEAGGTRKMEGKVEKKNPQEQPLELKLKLY